MAGSFFMARLSKWTQILGCEGAVAIGSFLESDSISFEEAADLSRYLGPMADYPRLAFSMTAVRKAGEHLAKELVFTPETHEEIVETFTVANSWRDSHLYPMRSVRFSVRHRMRKASAHGDMASRTKTMGSIRRKLRDSTVRLDQMNDLGGCRAIMDDIAGVRALLESIGTDFPHEVRRHYPYIQNPKNDGYRSHHVVFNYKPTNKETEPFEGRRVELQVRTRLQHSWATAVEAVSLYRGQDLKHGQGDPDWLRLFALVAAEFCYVENCPTHPDMPDHHTRIAQIKELEGCLGAANMLDNIKNATHFAENFIFERGRYFLITYTANHTVNVESYQSPIAMSNDLGNLEVEIERNDDGSRAVLVEVDKVDKLVDTYPNYFGDVSLFVNNLRRICTGKEAIEYSMTPQEVVPSKPTKWGDLQWLRRHYSKWEEGKR